MSDYLDKLVARSVSPLAVVRPRLLSLFEPPGTSHGLVHGSDIEPAPSDAEQVMERSPGGDRVPQLQSLWSSELNLQDAGPTVRTPLESIQPETVERVEPRDMDAGLTVQTPLESIQSETVRRVEPRDLDAGASGRTQVPHQRSPAKRAQVRGLPFAAGTETVTPEAVPHAVEAVSPLPSQAPVIPLAEVTQKRRAETAHPRVRQGDDGSAKRSRADNQETKASLKPEIPVPATTEAKTPGAANPGPDYTSDGFAGEQRSQQQIRPKPASLTRTGADQRPKSLPTMPIVPASIIASPRILPPPPQLEHAIERPSIHVTIGRVEVRAAPPPARSRQQAAQARVMSLDEYLRQRASGVSR